MKGPTAIGVDVGASHVLAVLVDSDGEVLRVASGPAPSASAADTAAAIGALVRELIPDEVVGVGVGVAGQVDFQTGSVCISPNIGWRDVPLRRLIEREVGLPVILDNDAHAAALGEVRWGAGAGHDPVLVVTWGTGIGGGLVAGGRIYRGRWGGGLEIGHIMVMPRGPRCGCGNRGCLEALAGGRSIEAEYERRAGRRASVREIAGLARQGQGEARAVLRRAARFLGRALGGLVNLFQPEMVILVGGIAGAADLVLDVVREGLRTQALPGVNREIVTVVGELGEMAGPLGAACLALERWGGAS